MTHKIAIVTHDLSQGGGVGTKTRFLWQVLSSSQLYEVDIISLAMSTSDQASLLVKKPTTWVRDIQVRSASWQNLEYLHVGAVFSELEYQRYRPRKVLTNLLRTYDLIQFVLGSPPWARVAEHVDRPILIWTATTTRADRESQLHEGSLARRTWSSLMVSIAERYERRALKTADRVFALSKYTRELIEPIAGAHKVLLAPCGVDTNIFRPSVKASGNYILWVGRLSDPRKNIRLLLEAYAKIHSTLKESPDLFLVGERLSDSDLAFVKAAELENRIRLVEKQEITELADLYRNARLFVLSSNEEGLGIVILEAMASGIPVVSTDCGGPATAITNGETGFLTPVGDAGALAAAMEKLLVDPALRERMGREGRRLAEERFSLSAAGRIFLDTYDQLLTRKTARVPAATSLQNSALPTPASMHD